MHDSITSQIFSFGRLDVFITKPHQPFLTLNQIHSSTLIDIRKIQMHSREDADGYYIPLNYQSIPFSILTADCMPILISGKEGHCFLHAGWKGLKNGVLENPFIRKINPIFAFIGPHIQKCCYTVTNEFLSLFHHRQAYSEQEGKLYFSLSTMAEVILKNQYPLIKIESSILCTCCDIRFHSYRRNQTKERNYNLFTLN